jgi:hypothetical protein
MQDEVVHYDLWLIYYGLICRLFRFSRCWWNSIAPRGFWHGQSVGIRQAHVGNSITNGTNATEWARLPRITIEPADVDQRLHCDNGYWTWVGSVLVSGGTDLDDRIDLSMITH